MLVRRMILLSLPFAVLLFLLASGCFGPGVQFGAPGTSGTTGIKGTVAMPGENNCYTLNCPNPWVSEGNEPAPQANVVLYGEGGQVLQATTDNCGKYEVGGAQEACYILYAQVPGGDARVKQGIVVESGKTNDAGEANAYTTAQVIIYEVAKSLKYDVKCGDIPNFVPTEELVAAVRKALAECRDAQSDGVVRALATDAVVSVFGAPCVVCAPCEEGDAPKADFDYKIEWTKEGVLVTFNNKSTGSGNRYIWNFGDGQTSKDKNPTHLYTGLGPYTVTLTATNRCGSDTISASLNFAQVCPPEDIYSITASISGPDSGETGATLTFSASSTQSPMEYPVTYSWDLDNDGQFDDGTGETVSHSFTTPGTYTIKVKAETDCGSAVAEKSVEITGCCSYYFHEHEANWRKIHE
ncbi:MAG: PKD domain-containing protein, partial [Candidatus Caldatribacteriaceae bacterium]